MDTNMLKRIAKKVIRIADEIDHIGSYNYSNSLKASSDDILEIEKEIVAIISTKVAQTHSDEQLADSYSAAGELIATVDRIAIQTGIKPEDKKYLVKIRDSIMRTLKRLDNFYKTKLNPKFNYHGITYSMLNLRIAGLKQAWKTMREICARK